MEATN